MVEIGAHLVPWKLKLCFECGRDGSESAVEKMKQMKLEGEVPAVL